MWRFAKRVSKGVIALTAVAVAVWFGRSISNSDLAQHIVSSFGYVGVLIVSAISGFNFAVPIPPISFLPLYLASNLNFWLSILAISVGMTIADGAAFLIGRESRHFITEKHEGRIFPRLERLKDWYYWAPPIVLFFFAAFGPAPNEILVAPMGFMGYRLEHILIPVFFGSLVFNTLFAFGITTFIM